MLGDDGADEELDDVEDHQRQNVDADILGGEEQERHRQAADLTLLRTAEQEHDAIGPIEPEHSAQADEDAEHEGQQDRGQGDDLEQIHRRNDRPQSLRDAGAECGIDDEQDRPLIDDGHEDAVLGQPGADVPVQQLTGDEGDDELADDLEDRLRGHLDLRAQQRGREQGREDHAEDIRYGRRTHGQGHIAAGDRRERDRGLHGRGQQTEEEEARRDDRADDGRRQKRDEQADRREEHEGADEHEELERPPPEAGERLSGGELRAVEEEEQTDRGDGQSVERLGGPIANGKQRRHHRDEHQGSQERVDAKTAEDTHRTRFASKRHADNVIELDTVIG